MQFLRKKKANIRMPTGRDAVNFRKLLFLPVPDTQDLLTNKDWERLDLRCVTLMHTKMLRASCIARGVPKKGGKRALAQRIMASLSEQKSAEFQRRQHEEEEYERHLDMLGGIWSFGSGYSGQLGHGDLESSSTPRLIKKLRGRVGELTFAPALDLDRKGFDSDVAFAVSRSGDVFVWGKRTGPTGLLKDVSLNTLLKRTYRGSDGELDSSDEDEQADDGGIETVHDSVKGTNNENDEDEDGGEEDLVHPVKLSRLCGEGVNYIAVGRVHCIAKTKDGDVFTWGHNDHCQLGREPVHNLTAAQSKKARVRYGLDCHEPQLWERTIPETCVITAVAAGTNHTFAITAQSELLAFGQFFVTDETSSLARSLAKLQVTQISCGAMHAGLVTSNGQVYTWGSGDGGRLGHGDVTSYVNPKLVEALKEDVIFELSCACWHTVAVVLIPPLVKGGLVYTWGTGRLGQLAQGGKQFVTTPRLVTDFLVTHVLIRTVCAGMFHNVALSVDDEVFTWGSNTNGCLGRPTELADLEEAFCAVPGKVEEMDSFVGRPCSIACGREFTLIATKPYIGLSREELEKREAEELEKAARLEREAKNVHVARRNKLDRIRRDKISLITSYLNASYPKCSICRIGTTCPGFQRDSVNPAMCKHCMHEQRKHDDRHDQKDQTLGALVHFYEVLEKLAVDLDYSTISDIELEDELEEELISDELQ